MPQVVIYSAELRSFSSVSGSIVWRVHWQWRAAKSSHCLVLFINC